MATPSLHPTTLMTELSGDHKYIIPSGNLFVFPFSISSEEAKNIFLMHIDQTQQDRSLRVWISAEVAGGLVDGDPDIALWHPGRNPHHVVGVYDKDYHAPDSAFVLPLPVGDYFLNVLNLTNRQNAFAYYIDGAG